MGGHIESLLRAGLSVVLDFPANTVANRQWMRGLFEQAGVAHRLHFIDMPDAVCKTRLRQRNAAGTHQFTVSDAEFDDFDLRWEWKLASSGNSGVKYFVPESIH